MAVHWLRVPSWSGSNQLQSLSRLIITVVVAKSSSPVRLQMQLMQSAALAGSLHQRSAAQQVEYWAALGREVAAMVDPEQLLDVKSGLARLRVEPVRVAAVDPQHVFAALEDARKRGNLSASVCTGAQNPVNVRYQASSTHPGWLEQLNADGSRRLGTFVDGVFRPSETN